MHVIFIFLLFSIIIVQIQKEIGLTLDVIVECVQSYDIEDIATENVKALFELLPTENEVTPEFSVFLTVQDTDEKM